MVVWVLKKNDFRDRNTLLEKYVFSAPSVTNLFQMLTLRVILIYSKGSVESGKAQMCHAKPEPC